MKIHQLLALAALPFAFAACTKSDKAEAEKKIEKATEEAKAAGDDAAAKIKQAAADAEKAAKEGVDKAKAAGDDAVDKAKAATEEAKQKAADGLDNAADKLRE